MNILKKKTDEFASPDAMMRKDKLKFPKLRLKGNPSSEVCPPGIAVGQRIDDYLSILSDNTSDIIVPLNVHIASDPKVLKRDKNTRTVFVAVPNGVDAGDEFVFFVEENLAVRVHAPPTSKYGDILSVKIPKILPSSINDSNSSASSQVQVFDVSVPPNVSKGQSLVIMAGGRPFLISSLPEYENRLQLHLPMKLLLKRDNSERAKTAKTSNGWTLAISIPDLHTKWTRMDDHGVLINSQPDFFSSAFIRNMDDIDHSSQFMLEGEISLSNASDVLRNKNDTLMENKLDPIAAQNLQYTEKLEWFRRRISKHVAESSNKTLWISIRRENLLSDSLNSIMSLSREDLRKNWNIAFAGEKSINPEMAKKEWFDMITEEILHPENGLFQFSASTNDMCIQINPTSAISFPDSHLIYFRVLGRILAKALCEGLQIPNHMSSHLFKMIVGWPLIFEDLKLIDQECYDFFVSVKKTSSEQLARMKINFTAMIDVMGCSEEIELCQGGKARAVDMDNKAEYLELNLKYYLFDEVKEQLTEFLLGFYDLIPEPLVSIFDPEEIELVMCGEKMIDVQDWKRNTEYTGEFQDLGEYHPVCCWFWDIVENYFDQETRVLLLKYATGTSSVPVGGFAQLQGKNGQYQKFTLHGLRFEDCPFPKADTMINRILLPLYENSNLMYETLVPSLQDGSREQ